MNFFDWLFGRRETDSKEVAKNRLQLVLVHDRSKIPPALLETLKNELIATISKYVTIDADAVEVSLDADSGRRLVADIPILSTEAPRRANSRAMRPSPHARSQIFLSRTSPINSNKCGSPKLPARDVSRTKATYHAAMGS